jgi:hypothetical protein
MRSSPARPVFETQVPSVNQSKLEGAKQPRTKAIEKGFANPAPSVSQSQEEGTKVAGSGRENCIQQYYSTCYLVPFTICWPKRSPAYEDGLASLTFHNMFPVLNSGIASGISEPANG